MGLVGVLSVVSTSPVGHAVGMAGDARATTFVTGPDGLLGAELINVLVSRGYRVLALARSRVSAEAVRRLGATPVLGDLLTPGRWQDEAAADWVLHLPPQLVGCGHVLRTRAARMARLRLLSDANLLDAVSAGTTRRIVYVADARSYGAVGSRAVTEDEPPCPAASERWLVPALDRLDGYVLAGLPIVTAVPGCVYGNGSWFRKLVVDPVVTGRRVLQFGGAGPLVSPIHVHDFARALVHLAEHGAAGGRYFLANTQPVRMAEFATTVARLADRPLRVWRLPAGATRFLVGRTRAEYPRADAILSNIRLRGTGFQFEHPTLEHGVRQVLRAFHE